MFAIGEAATKQETSPTTKKQNIGINFAVREVVVESNIFKNKNVQVIKPEASAVKAESGKQVPGAAGAIPIAAYRLFANNATWVGNFALEAPAGVKPNQAATAPKNV